MDDVRPTPFGAGCPVGASRPGEGAQVTSDPNNLGRHRSRRESMRLRNVRGYAAQPGVPAGASPPLNWAVHGHILIAQFIDVEDRSRCEEAADLCRTRLGRGATSGLQLQPMTQIDTVGFNTPEKRLVPLCAASPVLLGCG